MDFSNYWDNIHKNYTSSYDGWLEKYLPFFNTKKVFLELGCGRAYNSKRLLELGYKNITACDLSSEVINILKDECQELNSFCCDIAKPLPFSDGTIDVIIADLVLHYFNNQTMKEIVKELDRILDKDGYLIMRVNSSNDNYTKPGKDKEIEEEFYFDGDIYKKYYNEEELRKLFKNFTIYYIEEKKMDRYKKPKILWELCLRKK